MKFNFKDPRGINPPFGKHRGSIGVSLLGLLCLGCKLGGLYRADIVMFLFADVVSLNGVPGFCKFAAALWRHSMPREDFWM